MRQYWLIAKRRRQKKWTHRNWQQRRKHLNCTTHWTRAIGLLGENKIRRSVVVTVAMATNHPSSKMTIKICIISLVQMQNTMPLATSVPNCADTKSCSVVETIKEHWRICRTTNSMHHINSATKKAHFWMLRGLAWGADREKKTS